MIQDKYSDKELLKKLSIIQDNKCYNCEHTLDDSMSEYYEYIFNQGICPYCGLLLPKISQTIIEKDYTK